MEVIVTMENKCKCIICGLYKERSLEHIIPKALGNESLKTYDVCKDCNSKLGDNVDSYLNNNFFIQIIRQALGIVGQSGKIPNPFKDGVDESGQRMRVDQDHKPHVVPHSKTEDNKLHIVAETKKEVVEMGLKTLKRMNADDALIQRFLKEVEKTPVYETSPTLKYDIEVDFKRLYLAALKMAYEYACLKLGEDYCTDPTAKEIRSILYDATKGIYDKQYQKVCLAPQVLTDLLQSATHLNCHMIMMAPDLGNQLVVNVILFMSAAFSFSICVSNDATRYQELLKCGAITDIVDIHVSTS